MLEVGSDEVFTPGKVIISRVKPRDLSEADYHNLHLVELVSLGYGYTGTADYLLEQAKIEYDGEEKEDRFDIFLALFQGKAIGSLSASDWSINEPHRGKSFWNKLAENDRQIFLRAKVFAHAFNVEGIVTHPDFRNKGIARKLLKEAVIQLHPAFIVGQTKTPEAVMTRTNVLGDLGYLTFYGDQELAENPSQKSSSAVTNAYLSARGVTLDEHGLLYADTELLLPTVPDVSHCPQYIQNAFKNVIEGQKRVGNIKTAVKPLISIHKDIL